MPINWNVSSNWNQRVLTVMCLPASTSIPEFTTIPENSATTIFSGIRVGICTLPLYEKCYFNHLYSTEDKIKMILMYFIKAKVFLFQ